MAKSKIEKVAMNVRIPKALHEAINELVESEGRHKEFVVSRLLEKAIAAREVNHG